MENDKSKFKIEFKKRMYHWVLKLIKTVDSLKFSDNSGQIISKQLIRSGSIMLKQIRPAQEKISLIFSLIH